MPKTTNPPASFAPVRPSLGRRHGLRSCSHHGLHFHGLQLNVQTESCFELGLAASRTQSNALVCFPPTLVSHIARLLMSTVSVGLAAQCSTRNHRLDAEVSGKRPKAVCPSPSCTIVVAGKEVRKFIGCAGEASFHDALRVRSGTWKLNHVDLRVRPTVQAWLDACRPVHLAIVAPRATSQAQQRFPPRGQDGFPQLPQTQITPSGCPAQVFVVRCSKNA